MKEIVFLGMGGTIAGRAASSRDNVGYRAGQVSIDDLLSGVEGLSQALRDHRALSEQVAQIDSKDMEPAHWVALAKRIAYHLARDDVAGVVVTHGTDTLEETAFFLASVLPPKWLGNKPVVLTCAMRPASAAYPDGPGNLVDAAVVASEPLARGVLVVCAGNVHEGHYVHKVHPYHVDPFDSGEAGRLGCIEEGRLRLYRQWPPAPERTNHIDLETLPASDWPWIEIVTSHAGAGARAVRAMLAALPDASGPLRGLVVAGTGNGTLHYQLEVALQEALQRGVRVVRTTRCAQGQIVLPPGNDPRAPRGITAATLSPVKARIALMLELLS